jgi:hypothetical protein
MTAPTITTYCATKLSPIFAIFTFRILECQGAPQIFVYVFIDLHVNSFTS